MLHPWTELNPESGTLKKIFIGVLAVLIISVLVIFATLGRAGATLKITVFSLLGICIGFAVSTS